MSQELCGLIQAGKLDDGLNDIAWAISEGKALGGIQHEIVNAVRIVLYRTRSDSATGAWAVDIQVVAELLSKAMRIAYDRGFMDGHAADSLAYAEEAAGADI